MTNAAFFINPLSHTVKKRGSVLAKCADLAAFPPIVLDPFHTIEDGIRTAAKAQCTHFFIEGGDGTIQGVLSALMHGRDQFTPVPKIVLLPGGMTNVIAKQLGMKSPTPKSIKSIITQSKPTKLRTLPMLKVQDEANPPYFGFLLSTGALPRGTRLCKAEIHKRGLKGSTAIIATIAKVLFSNKSLRADILKPTPFSLSSAEQIVEGNHILFLASTLKQSLSSLHIFWGGDTNPICVSHVREGAKHILRNVISMRKTHKSKRLKARLERDGFNSWNMDDLKIIHAGDIVLDGEFLPRTEHPVHISATGPLSFLSLL